LKDIDTRQQDLQLQHSYIELLIHVKRTQQTIDQRLRRYEYA